MKTDMQRALASWGFIAAVIGTGAVLFFGSFDSLLPLMQNAMGQQGIQAGFHDQVLLSALQSNVLLLAAPILAALPYTAAFVDDCKSGILKEYLPRSGKKEYVRGKVLASGLSGGLALFLGILLTYIIFALVLTPMEVVPQIPDQSAAGAVVMAGPAPQPMQMPSMFPQVLSGAFLFFLAGCFWSLVGALFAGLTMSRYMAYAFPFILYYVLIILCTRYFTGLVILNPQGWVNPMAEWPGGMWGMALFMGELIVSVAVLYSVAVKRRLADV